MRVTGTEGVQQLFTILLALWAFSVTLRVKSLEILCFQGCKLYLDRATAYRLSASGLHTP